MVVFGRHTICVGEIMLTLDKNMTPMIQNLTFMDRIHFLIGIIVQILRDRFSI